MPPPQSGLHVLPAVTLYLIILISPFHNYPWPQEISSFRCPSHRATGSQWIEVEAQSPCPLALSWDNSQGPLQLQITSQGLSYNLLKDQDFLLLNPTSFTSVQVSVDLMISSWWIPCLQHCLSMLSWREINISVIYVYLAYSNQHYVLRCPLGKTVLQ